MAVRLMLYRWVAFQTICRFNFLLAPCAGTAAPFDYFPYPLPFPWTYRGSPLHPEGEVIPHLLGLAVVRNGFSVASVLFWFVKALAEEQDRETISGLS